MEGKNPPAGWNCWMTGIFGNKLISSGNAELQKIVGLRVEELTKGLQKPACRNETIAVDWDAW